MASSDSTANEFTPITYVENGVTHTIPFKEAVLAVFADIGVESPRADGDVASLRLPPRVWLRVFQTIANSVDITPVVPQVAPVQQVAPVAFEPPVKKKRGFWGWLKRLVAADTTA